MNRCILTLSLSCLAVGSHAQEDAGDRRRSGGLGQAQGASNYEWVSSEPLTFDYVEPEPVDRERLLADAEIEEGSEFDWMEDYDVQDFEVMKGLDLFEGEESWFVSADEDEAEEHEWVSSVDEEEQPEFDSSYDSVDGENFYEEEEEGLEEFDEDSEGYDETGSPKAINEPITRRLRRITPVVQENDMNGERYLAEKEKLRAEHDSMPIVSLKPPYF